MKITGELLKTERVTQGLTIQTVAHALKLNQKMVIALESGDLSQLPAKTFIRGFVKSYAQYLKLDADAVLRQFQEEMGSTSPLPKVPPPTGNENTSIRAPKPTLRHTSQNYSQDKSITSQAIREQDLAEKHFNNKILFFLMGAAALVIVIVSATRFIETDDTVPAASSGETSSTQVIAPNYNSVDPNTVAESNDASSAQVASGDITRPGGAPVALPAAAETSSTVTAAPTTNTTVPSPAQKQPVAENPLTDVVSTPDDDIPPSPGKPIELVLESKRDVEIFYARGNTRQFKSLKLTANKVQIIRSATGLHIKASDGGAFKITANGIEQGAAGANNKPVKLSF